MGDAAALGALAVVQARYPLDAFEAVATFLTFIFIQGHGDPPVQSANRSTIWYFVN
jgi:hypothetical protein